MLDKDILGLALYTGRTIFNNRTMASLIQQYGTLENVRLAESKADALAIITHLTTAGLISVTVNTTGTATAQTGTGTGKMT